RPFTTVNRVHKLAAPSNDPELLADEAVALLDRIERRRPVRLLGVRLEMTPPTGEAEAVAGRESTRMPRIAIVTDSTASLPVEVVAEWGIEAIPLQVAVGAT